MVIINNYKTIKSYLSIIMAYVMGNSGSPLNNFFIKNMV